MCYEKKECIFCDIVKRKKEAYIVAENEKVLSFLDVNPVADGHVLIITKEHFSDISKLDDGSWKAINHILKELIEKQKKYLNVNNFNVISNIGSLAFQSVFHFHMHLIPKFEKEQGFLWSFVVKPGNLTSLKKVSEKLLQNN